MCSHKFPRLMRKSPFSAWGIISRSCRDRSIHIFVHLCTQYYIVHSESSRSKSGRKRRGAPSLRGGGVGGGARVVAAAKQVVESAHATATTAATRRTSTPPLHARPKRKRVCAEFFILQGRKSFLVLLVFSFSSFSRKLSFFLNTATSYLGGLCRRPPALSSHSPEDLSEERNEQEKAASGLWSGDKPGFFSPYSLSFGFL